MVVTAPPTPPLPEELTALLRRMRLPYALQMMYLSLHQMR